jgi:DNA-binding IclR family transcriptional regulator
MTTGESASDKDAASSLTLRRGLQVLRTVSEHADGISVSQLATLLETHRAGIYRLVGPLIEQRLVERSENGRLIFLGTGLIELASRVRGRLQQVAGPRLQQLADDFEVTTALTFRDGDEGVVARVHEPRTASMHITYQSGLRHPLTVAAPGLAILASGPALPNERPEVARAREVGWVRTSGELLPGTTGVAVAIRDASANHREASISAVWISEREEGPIVEALQRTAEIITEHLG